MTDWTPAKATVETYNRRGLKASEAHVYDPSYVDHLAKMADKLPTESEMAAELGVSATTFKHWVVTIEAFREVVYALNAKRSAKFERVAMDAALGEGDKPYMGDGKLLGMFLQAENPEKFAAKTLNINKNINSNYDNGLSKLEKLSSASFDEHFSEVSYEDITYAEATQLVAEVFDTLPPAYAAALQKFMELGLTEPPPSYIVQEDIPSHDAERAIQSATAQWLISQGVNPVTAISSEGAKPARGRPQSGSRSNQTVDDDVEDAEIVDEDAPDFFGE